MTGAGFRSRHDHSCLAEAAASIQLMRDREVALEQAHAVCDIYRALSRFSAACAPLSSSRWLRRRRDHILEQLPPWQISPRTCVQRYLSILGLYVDVAAWALLRHLAGTSLADMAVQARHAWAVDVGFWLMNRRSAAGLDETLCRTDQELTD